MKIRLLAPHNGKVILECGEPTNLFINDTQLFSGDEVKADVNTKKKLGVVQVFYDGGVQISTNKEVKCYYKTQEGIYKATDLELVRSFKDYKNGDFVANGRKYKGFLVEITE